ncbi:tRNA lysidine(34) synthetase TilS [Granulosicoccaceae sp. 1_MG-2023]|nr:tRNA lysidine(34) synthetase TilS [Granulosicoccaceae sp. 1_MG-2023]
MTGLPDPSALAAGIAALPGTRRVRLALSGGLDSRVLLHLALQACRAGGWPLDALHVDHGLQQDSAQWADFCQRLCDEAGIGLLIHQARLAPLPGQSVEALARDARYGFFRSQLQAGDLLLLAQHADDQAETVLLQLLRGAGPAGLAAMPAQAPLGLGSLLRPLLGCNREQLRDYARGHGLQWVEDPSNSDTRFDRNYLREQLTPRLTQRFPAYRRTLARSAANCAEAAALLTELAEQDYAGCADSQAAGLCWQRFTALSEMRQRNLLRYLFRRCDLPVPGRAQLQAIQTDFLRAAADAQPLFRAHGWCLRLSRGRLTLAPEAAAAAVFDYAWPDSSVPLHIPELGLTLTREGLRARAGVALPAGLSLRVSCRRGGEKIRVRQGAGRRRLKSLFQEAGIPAAARADYVLIWQDDELIAVPGLAVDPRYAVRD